MYYWIWLADILFRIFVFMSIGETDFLFSFCINFLSEFSIKVMLTQNKLRPFPFLPILWKSLYKDGFIFFL